MTSHHKFAVIFIYTKDNSQYKLPFKWIVFDCDSLLSCWHGGHNKAMRVCKGPDLSWWKRRDRLRPSLRPTQPADQAVREHSRLRTLRSCQEFCLIIFTRSHTGTCLILKCWDIKLFTSRPAVPACCFIFWQVECKNVLFFPPLFLLLGCNFPSLANTNANHFMLKHPTTPENKDSQSVCTSIPFVHTEFSNSGPHSLLILADIILCSSDVLLVSVPAFSRYSLQNSNLPSPLNDSWLSGNGAPESDWWLQLIRNKWQLAERGWKVWCFQATTANQRKTTALSLMLPLFYFCSWNPMKDNQSVQ